MKTGKTEKVGFYLIFALFCVLSCFRDFSIYPDLEAYEKFFFTISRADTIGEALLYSHLREFEVGYGVLNFIVSRFTVDVYVFFVIVGIIVCFGYSYAIFQYSKNELFSFLFICFYPLLFPQSFYALRQQLALSVVLYSLRYIKDEKPIRYLMFNLIAGSLHISAFIMLPLLLVRKMDLQKLKLKHIVLFIASYVIFNIVVNVVLGSSERYYHYLDESANSGILSFALFIIPIVFVYKTCKTRYPLNKYPISSDFDKMMLDFVVYGGAITFFLIGCNIGRLAIYFVALLSFIVPWIFEKYPMGTRFCVYSVYMLIIFYLLMINNTDYSILDYRFR